MAPQVALRYACSPTGAAPRWSTKPLFLGLDLHGNQFYELYSPTSPTRPRRIVQYANSIHPGDVALTPAWLQWLRHTRPEAPSIPDQQYEVQRQSQLKQLAAAADARWASKPSFLDAPSEMGQPRPLMEPRDQGGYNDSVKEAGDPGVVSPVTSPLEQAEERVAGQQPPRKEKDNPWDAAKGSNPGQDWQPQGWVPGKIERR